MPLSSAGIAAGQIIKSAEVLQFFNLLTGVMTDQTVNIANQIVCNSLSVVGVAGDTSINKGGRFIGAVNGTTPSGGPYLVGDTVIDRTNGTLMVCTVAGSPGTWNIVGGASGTLAVSGGGTGRTSFTAHGVLLGNAASGINATAVGATNTVLHGNSGADPSYSQVTGFDIANGTITNANIAAGTITSGNLAGGATVGNLATFGSFNGAYNPIPGSASNNVGMSIRLDGSPWIQISGYAEIAGDNAIECMSGAYSLTMGGGSHQIDLGVDANNGSSPVVVCTDTKTTHGGTVYVTAVGTAGETGSGGSGRQVFNCSFIGIER